MSVRIDKTHWLNFAKDHHVIQQDEQDDLVYSGTYMQVWVSRVHLGKDGRPLVTILKYRREHDNERGGLIVDEEKEYA